MREFLLAFLFQAMVGVLFFMLILINLKLYWPGLFRGPCP